VAGKRYVLTILAPLDYVQPLALVLLNEDIFELPRNILDYHCLVLLALGNNSGFCISLAGEVNE